MTEKNFRNRVKVTLSSGVADVVLVREDKMNALDNDMFEALIEAGDYVSQEASARVVVLSGAGRAFCAGLDMGNFGKMAEAKPGGSPERVPLEQRTHGIANRPQQAVWVWRECPVPVIAAVHGVAFGGGFQLCLGADVRIVAPDTRMSIMEIKWGLIPDMAGTAIMRAIARDDVVRSLTYSGRIFSGSEALTFGFATEVAESPREVALALAKEIASKSPSAVQSAKRIYNRLPDLSDAEALLQESKEQDQVIGKPNQIEAVMASLQKRDAAFEDLR